MHRRNFFEAVSKSLTSELNRLLWNKERTINSYSVKKGNEKLTILVEFSLKPPYSDNSSIMIIVRFSGIIEKWVNVWDKGKNEKLTPIDLFKNNNILTITESEVKSMSKQLLKEIDS